ncbi:MAG: aminotransferase class III-fold pyridoxal phosphate-dependent enzyme, partial [Gammaproteobacteria bacterium]
MEKPLMPSYRRLSVAFVRGQGAWLWDDQGRRYLDAVSGIAVCGLGHAHPAVAQAVAEQSAALVHTSNLYRVPLQESLGARLTQLSGMDNAFFCNSGAEANEAAIKIARLLGHERGIDLPTIVVMEGAFHGRTLATLSATANRKVQRGFEPLVQGFVRVPYDDPEALGQTASQR